jgi:hypothetical protein
VVLTISKLKRWSINDYNQTAQAGGEATKGSRRANGGLGEYHLEQETRTPVWLVAGDRAAAACLVGLRDVQRAGGEADIEVVALWLDEGIVPNNASDLVVATQVTQADGQTVTFRVYQRFAEYASPNWYRSGPVHMSSPLPHS